MSKKQKDWLTETLKKARKADHVFIFLHHPRWWDGSLYGTDWKSVHTILKKAGNVSAVFAGHCHRMGYDGIRDGIEYFTVAITGGKLLAKRPEAGFLHHINLVTVRPGRFAVAGIPVGTIVDARKIWMKGFTYKFMKQKTLLEKVEFNIEKDKDRILKYKINIPEFERRHGLLRIGVEHSYDDAGDKGMNYYFADEKKCVVKSGFMSTKEVYWIEFEVTSKSKWTFVLEDLDTKFDGDFPGNGGHIQIELKY